MSWNERIRMHIRKRRKELKELQQELQHRLEGTSGQWRKELERRIEDVEHDILDSIDDMV